MGPNSAELIRVFTRQVNGVVADVTFADNADFEVVVEVEAGEAIFNAGTQYQTGIVLRDKTAADIIQTTPQFSGGGGVPADTAGFGPEGMSLAGTEWLTQTNLFVYRVAAADLAGRENHICEILAYLRARVRNPDISFAASSYFMITPP